MALCRLKALKKDLVLDLESDGDSQPEEQELTLRRLEKMKRSARALKKRTVRKKRRHSSTDESDEEQIEEHLSEKEQEENLRLQTQLAEEKKKNAQLQQLLTEKIDLLLAHFGIGGTKPQGKTQMSLSASLNKMRKEVSSPLAARSDHIPKPAQRSSTPVSTQSAPVTPSCTQCPKLASNGQKLTNGKVEEVPEKATNHCSTSLTKPRTNIVISQAIIPEQPQASSQGHQELPLFEDTNGQVHLGDGLFVSSEQWTMLMRLPRDSLFCKEGIRCLWRADELQDRSVRGLVCRRFIRSEVPRTAKRPLTPVKLQALGRAYDHYIAHHPADNATPHQRAKKMNSYLAEFLQTYRRR